MTGAFAVILVAGGTDFVVSFMKDRALAWITLVGVSVEDDMVNGGRSTTLSNLANGA